LEHHSESLEKLNFSNTLLVVDEPNDAAWLPIFELMVDMPRLRKIELSHLALEYDDGNQSSKSEDFEESANEKVIAEKEEIAMVLRETLRQPLSFRLDLHVDRVIFRFPVHRSQVGGTTVT
jgi:hypothetical protein